MACGKQWESRESHPLLHVGHARGAPLALSRSEEMEISASLPSLWGAVSMTRGRIGSSVRRMEKNGLRAYMQESQVCGQQLPLLRHMARGQVHQQVVGDLWLSKVIKRTPEV